MWRSTSWLYLQHKATNSLRLSIDNVRNITLSERRVCTVATRSVYVGLLVVIMALIYIQQHWNIHRKQLFQATSNLCRFVFDNDHASQPYINVGRPMQYGELSRTTTTTDGEDESIRYCTKMTRVRIIADELRLWDYYRCLGGSAFYVSTCFTLSVAFRHLFEFTL